MFISDCARQTVEDLRMCRLFAFVAPHASTVDAELGNSGLHCLISLAQVHGDGWGWSGVSEVGSQPIVHKSPLSAAADPQFHSTLSTRARAAMVHLRWATLGLEIGDENTHPFLAEGISFEHNGSLKPIERVRALLSPHSLNEMHGDTDSEMYFALIREKTSAGLSLPAATLTTVRELRETYPTASLNAFVLDAEHLVVVHANARTFLSDEDVVLLREFDLPDSHADDYYSLQWLTKPDGTVLIGSTGVAEAGWRAMPAESVITISLADGAVSIAQILTD